jgi:hypothetical protein
MTDNNTPAVGQRIIAVTVPGATDYNGKECTVTHAEPGYIRGEFQSISKPDDTMNFGFREWKPLDDITFATRDRMVGRFIKVIYSGSSFVNEGEIHKVTSVFSGREDQAQYQPKVDGITVGVTVGDHGNCWVQSYDLLPDGYIIEPVEAVQPSLEDLQAQVQSLTEERDRWQTRYNDAVVSRDSWRQDFTTYADRILQEAIDRDWCEEYERVMGDIENDLTVASLPEREQEYEVEVEISGNVSTTYTVAVTARSQDDADRMVKEDPSEYFDAEEQLRESIRYNGFDDVEVSIA